MKLADPIDFLPDEDYLASLSPEQRKDVEDWIAVWHEIANSPLGRIARSCPPEPGCVADRVFPKETGS